jgi:hypothetical protein
VPRDLVITRASGLWLCVCVNSLFPPLTFLSVDLWESNIYTHVQRHFTSEHPSGDGYSAAWGALACLGVGGGPKSSLPPSFLPLSFSFSFPFPFFFFFFFFFCFFFFNVYRVETSLEAANLMGESYFFLQQQVPGCSATCS